MTMQIVGAGFGRTGTKSLQLALEQLGFDKCYHMEELFRNSAGVKHWQDAYDRKDTDWNDLFKGYKSIVDFPGSAYYKEIAAYYPDSKVILTTRDPEKWYDSALRTIYAFDPGPALKIKMLLMMPFSSTARNFFKVIQLNNKSLWGRLFGGKFEDKDHAISVFNNHIEEVKRTIPADRLLVYKVSEGWEPLCAFLGVDVPDTPFPNTNKGTDFHEWAKGIVRDVLS